MTRATTNGNQTINSPKAIVKSGSGANIMKWGIKEVVGFLTETLGDSRQNEMEGLVQKHHVTGVDLVEMNEQNLLELGIHTMHERK
jgi:hypothetical protein